MRNFVNRRGFTLFETVIALTIFVTVIVGGNALLKEFSSGVIEMQNVLQAEMLAKNGALLSRNIFLNQANVDWTASKAALLGTPKEGDFILSFSGAVYSLSPGTSFDGPINVYSETDPSKITTKFFRKIHLKQLETWGLYEIESSVCFNQCQSYSKVYDMFYRE